LRAAVVEAKDFVVDVQAVHDKRQAVSHADTALSVKFKMAVEIVVAEGTADAACSTVLKAIAGNVGLVVGKPNADREAAAVESRADIPAIWRIAKKTGVIGPAVKTARARGRIAIVCRETESAKNAGE
jgi:hypothetical protein